jgi:hypothetical protein
MKAEDVPAEWVDAAVDAAFSAYHKCPGHFAWEAEKDRFCRALAAVAPLIRRAAMEEAAGVAETHEWFVGGIGTKAPGSGQAKAIAAAIRALAKQETT